mmetsp:Transcript_15561/g.39421  ORF Transcript_15561/g.39421 Transcript_15561/m.39421 type:complete len:80 (+) Transcript_15561:65-304(+)
MRRTSQRCQKKESEEGQQLALTISLCKRAAACELRISPSPPLSLPFKKEEYEIVTGSCCYPASHTINIKNMYSRYNKEA